MTPAMQSTGPSWRVTNRGAPVARSYAPFVQKLTPVSLSRGYIDVNKAELCRALEISKPTLADWLARDADFPVVVRGGRGAPWKFDLAAVRRHLVDRKHARTDSLDDQIKRARLQAMRLAAAEKAGALVPVAQMQDTLAALFSGLSTDLVAFIAQLAREQGWPPAVKASVLRRLAEIKRAFVAKAPSLLERLSLPMFADAES